MNTPSDARPLLRADAEFLLAFLRRSEESDGALVVGIFRVVEEVSHEMLADGRNEVAGLVDIFVFLGLGRDIGDFADVDEVLDVELELGKPVISGGVRSLLMKPL